MEEMNCKFCESKKVTKNGYSRGVQRYRCKRCGKNCISGDKRGSQKYPAETKNMVIKMYLNNCGLRRISAIINIPLTTVFSWVKMAGQIVDKMVKDKKHEKEKIEILEMDELYTYIKKKKTKYEYGLLLIGTDSKMLHLK